MPNLCRFQVEGLFGTSDYDIPLEGEAEDVSVNVLTGINGSGKTHILRLIRAVMVVDVSELQRVAFSSCRIDFSDGTALMCTKTPDTHNIGASVLEFEKVGSDGRKKKFFDFNTSQLEELARAPTELGRLSLDTWTLPYRSTIMSSKDLLLRGTYRGSHLGFEYSTFEAATEFLRLTEVPWPVLIETKRLDSVVGLTRSGTSARLTKSPLSQYTYRIVERVSDARRKALHESQALSADFVNRAMAQAKSKKSVSEAQLRKDYVALEKTHKTLAENALIQDDSTPVAFPETTTPTLRTLLVTYLSDWRARLDPYEDVNERMTLLRELINSKLDASRKSIAFDSRGNVQVRFGDRRVPIDQLSSGEQHMLVLYILLIFGADDGAIVLIDEPEISLHVAWQEEFIPDMIRIARLRKLSLIIATHSPSIIGEYWDTVNQIVPQFHIDNAAIPSEAEISSAEDLDESDGESVDEID